MDDTQTKINTLTAGIAQFQTMIDAMNVAVVLLQAQLAQEQAAVQ